MVLRGHSPAARRRAANDCTSTPLIRSPQHRAVLVRTDGFGISDAARWMARNTYPSLSASGSSIRTLSVQNESLTEKAEKGGWKTAMRPSAS